MGVEIRTGFMETDFCTCCIVFCEFVFQRDGHSIAFRLDGFDCAVVKVCAEFTFLHIKADAVVTVYFPLFVGFDFENIGTFFCRFCQFGCRAPERSFAPVRDRILRERRDNSGYR